jgi:hypothetical protein
LKILKTWRGGHRKFTNNLNRGPVKIWAFFKTSSSPPPSPPPLRNKCTFPKLAQVVNWAYIKQLPNFTGIYLYKLWWYFTSIFITKVTELWNCIKNSYSISATPTNIYDRTYIFLKIRIVNMQKYVGVVIDVCGSGRYTNFLCDSTVPVTFVIIDGHVMGT